MADDIVKVIADTRADAATLQEVVNADENTQVTSRLGESYPSVQKAIKLMTQSGLSFTAFETKSLMTASSLANGSYAIVTNDTTTNNGLHLKKSGAWSKVSYDIDERQKNYTDTKAGEALTKANDAAAMADAVDLTIKSITSSETDRVGDAPELFSDVIKAEPDPIVLGTELYISQISKIGKVLTVKNKAGYVATRKALPVYSEHSYSLSASLLRVVNPTDPLNTTVEVGVEWLNQAKQSISHQVISSLTLDSADGITVIDEPIFPTAASAYARAWFRIYGSDSETALIHLSANDVTDNKKLADDITQSSSATLTSAKSYTDTASGNAVSAAAADATTKANSAQEAAITHADDLGVEQKESSDYVFAIVDEDDNIGFGLDKNGDITNPSIQRLEKETETLQDDIDNIGIEVLDGGTVFAIADEDGKVGFSLNKNGDITNPSIQRLEKETETLQDDIDNIGIEVLDGGTVFAIADEDGKVGFSLNKNGDITNPSIQRLEDANITTNERVDNLDFEVEVRVNPIKSDYMHLISYGQSLSIGSAALPVVSTTQPYNNVTWISGTIYRYDQEEHDYSSLKPLVEEQTTAAWGETPISGFANNFVAYQVENGDSAENWVMLGSSPGQGGARISQIYKGTVAYSSLISQIEAAYVLSQDLGKTYTVWSMAYTQGESDHKNNTYDGYYADLDKLYEDFATDSMAVTKQSFKPFMITYQTSSHMRYDVLSMHVARAQLQLSKDNPMFVMATPIYYLPHANDDVHLKADSSYHLGKCYAKAFNYTLETGEKFEPLRPIDILSQGRLIHVTFNKSGLVFDTTQVAETHNLGFDIWSGDTLVDTIVDVAIVDTNRVAITLSETPPDNTTLSYAKGRDGDALKAGNIEGTRGNLRDNAGDNDFYTTSAGSTMYMHNWCVLFQYEINGSI